MRCSRCGTTFAGRADAKFCSTRCRVAAHRANGSHLPAALTARPNWVLHRNKVPRCAFGGPASSTDPSTWCDFDTARDAADHGAVDGVGFVFDGTGIVGIDLDDCLHDGVLKDWAADIVAQCAGTYIEVSPSGHGLHIFGRGTVGTGRRMGQVEVYDRARYFTVTGRRWPGSSLRLADLTRVVQRLTA